MPSVNRAKNFGERINRTEEPQNTTRSFSCGYYVRAEQMRAVQIPGMQSKSKNNLKKLKKVLKST